MTTGPNVLLIILDGVRASNTSLGGHTRPTTPNLEQIAEQATVYRQAYAPSNWSLPSHTSLFTGYHVPEHRVTAQCDTLREGHTVWEYLRDTLGYSTGVFSQNQFITSNEFGLANGFDTIAGPVSARKYLFQDAPTPDNTHHNEALASRFQRIVQSDQPVRAAMNAFYCQLENALQRFQSIDHWIPQLPIRPRYRSPAAVHADLFHQWQQQQDGAWAACLNFMDANTMHFPWPAPGEWSGIIQQEIYQDLQHPRWDFYSGHEPWWKLQALEPWYDESIRISDAFLGEVYTALERSDALENTFVIVTSDHGDGLGERSNVRSGLRIAAHSTGIHECLLHVPLVVKVPGQDEGTEITTPVSITQFPTAVKEVLQTTSKRFLFDTDDPVISEARHDRLFEYLQRANEWQLNRYANEIDLSQFAGTARAVYEPHKGKVRKSISWGEDTTTVHLTNNAPHEQCSTKRSNRVKDIFKRFEQREIKDSPSELSTIDRSTLERLRNLGYT